MHITLENIKLYSLQAVFDYVAEHLLRQGEPAMTGNGCAYRGEGGLQCAVGFLIDDRMYEKLTDAIEGKTIVFKEFDKYFNSFERKSLNERYSYEDTQAALAADPYRNLLRKLQNIHDDGEPVKHNEEESGITVREYWRGKLHKLAAEQGLKVNFA
jgi:hypothetical protein